MHAAHYPVRDADQLREPQVSADPRRCKALAVVSVAQFMLILDLTVVNVALPDLSGDLGLSRTAFTWAVPSTCCSSAGCCCSATCSARAP
jgi:hypothetical protein